MKHNKWIAILLALTLVLNTVPVFAAAAETGNEDPVSDNNQITETPEEWIYIPSESAPTLNSSGEESSADLIKVRVTATDKVTGEQVDVPGATVNLYVGSALKSSVVDDDGDGIVEISLAGLSYEERQNATVSANKIVSRGKAIDGSARDDLYEHFPKDSEGDYYRYTMELHSETIDTNGNWLGAPIPEGTESNKVDIVFVIDATGSMSGEINNVRTNIASFAENLLESGLNIRFCIIDYRDITEGEPTNVHTVSGSHWMTDIDSVVSALGSIRASGGGDGPETVMDPLGYVADNGLMSWRSDAYKFAFVLTDADYKTSNNYGYTSMSQLVDQLADMKVVTSVITSTSYTGTYSNLYSSTGGIWANINSASFDEEMLALSDSIIESVTREMTLHLSEPRMLVNMAVCYLANDATSRSDAYQESVKAMLNEYANRMAESTDGHVLLDHVLLFSAGNRMDFYFDSDSSRQLASMADIRIETREQDDGTLLFNVQIHSNAHPFGYLMSDTVTMNQDLTDKFSHLKDSDSLTSKQTFRRIQLSAIEGAGWNNSMIDEAYAYSTTVMHETGHYLMGFLDEYLNADDKEWGIIFNKRPAGKYGLMDNQHSDIEMSNAVIDYAYMTDGFDAAAKELHTAHSWLWKGSCEDALAKFMSDSGMTSYDYYSTGLYAGTYTKVTGSTDRTATYSYASVSDDRFLSPYSTAGGGGSAGGRSAVLYSDSSTEPVLTRDSLADVTFTSNDETVTITVSADAAVGIMKAGDEAFTDVPLDEGAAELPIAKGELAEIRITVPSGETAKYNTYYIDRSKDTDAGCLYTSADNAVIAYVTTDELSSYTFIADNTGYTNGEYRSMNQATRISSDNGAGFDSGEIYSVASYLAEIDYTTLSWFKYSGGEWTALPTDLSEEENMNIGARADLDGEGLYVLMAKAASEDPVLPAENLAYTQSEDRDAVITLTFDDPNANSKYYNVYYSETYFSSKDAPDVVVRSFPVDSTELVLNLLERGRRVYAAVEIVAEDGRRSALSEILLIGGEADSDGDGIPDWYCDKYHLWGEPGEDKDIANSDDDSDGLTNLEEYLGGSDPTNPNDPVHTTNVPVESVSVSQTTLVLNVDQSVRLSATVYPGNATNRTINWHTDDTDLVSLTREESGCTVTGLAPGKTTVYAVSADGGYSATVAVTVLDRPDNSFGENIIWDLSEEGVLTFTGTGPMPDYDESALIPWKNLRSQILSVVIGDGITHVGQFAFYQCTNLESVRIPSNVTGIGAHAFYGCSALTEITLPESLTLLQSAAFEKCTSLTAVSIPGTVRSIAPYAFRDCTALNTLELRSGVEVIGTHAFRNCAALTSLVLPETVRKLGSHAFRDCTSLTSIAFTGSAPVFGTDVFAGVRATASYSSDDPTWTDDVLQDYGGDLTWMSSAITIRPTLVGSAGRITWDLTDEGTLVIRGSGAMTNYTDKTRMPWYSRRAQIRSVVIEDGITSIGSYAFYGLAITSVEIPESVTAIGDYAFKNVSRLKDVALPAGLTTLGDSAFYGIGTEQLTIPESVTSIGAWCFARSSIQAITFEGDAPAIGEGAFNKISLTARYPGDHATWTSAVMQNYGGRIHWSEK